MGMGSRGEEIGERNLKLIDPPRGDAIGERIGWKSGRACVLLFMTQKHTPKMQAMATPPAMARSRSMKMSSLAPPSP